MQAERSLEPPSTPAAPGRGRAGWRLPRLGMTPVGWTVLGVSAAALPLGYWPVAFVLVHVWLLYPMLRGPCQWFGPVVTEFRPAGREVWLTIDDGPDPVETPAILAELAAHDAKATFFVIGAKAARWPELIRAIQAAGHGLGNHTQRHPHRWFWCHSPRRIAAEVDDCAQTLAAITGAAPPLFRSPVGIKNIFVHPLLRARGLPLVCWTTRGLDGTSRNVRAIVARILKRVRPGAIILLHEGHGTAQETLPRLLGHLRQDGYRCVLPPAERLLAAGRPSTR